MTFSGAVFSWADLVSVDLPVFSPNFLLIGLFISFFCSVGSVGNFDVSLVFGFSGSVAAALFWICLGDWIELCLRRGGLVGTLSSMTVTDLVCVGGF